MAKTKTEDGQTYSKSDYAYTPTDNPSDWKLRVAEYVGGKKQHTPAQVGRAIAAMSSGGFRGNKVQLPADAVAGVKAKLRTVHGKANPKGQLPPHMKEAAISEAAQDVEITESEMVVELVEKAVRSDGTIPIKIINSGWGTSGFYPDNVLKRDGPKVFTEKTKMFWNHQTAAQEAEQPEGNLDNLAAVLVDGATWQENGKAGPGLYANAKVFGPYKEAINELAPYIGVSIRANGRATQGEAAGRKGSVIQEISHAKSIDFVTTPGAGGQIVSMFEAARSGKQPPDNGPIQPDQGQGVIMGDKAREVNMNDLQDVETKLAEANRKIEALNTMNTSLQEAQQRIKSMETDNARLKEAMLVRDAREFVAAELSRHQLPEPTRKRLLETLVSNPIIADGALDTTTYAVKVREAVQVETAYLASVAGYGNGAIQGMGGTFVQPDTSEKTGKRLTEAFAGLGLSGDELKYATRQ